MARRFEENTFVNDYNGGRHCPEIGASAIEQSSEGYEEKHVAGMGEVEDVAPYLDIFYEWQKEREEQQSWINY